MTTLNIDPADDVQAAGVPARGVPRRGPRSGLREPGRDPSRGEAVVRGRDGEILTRKRTGVGDIFAIPPELIEPGWEMQWNAVTVVGDTEVLTDQNLMMAENGWRPVNADREGFAGRFSPVGTKGAIIRGGQRLEERPKVLCDQARAEDIRNAKRLISDRNESLKLSGVTKGTAFEMGGRYRGTGGNVNMNLGRGVYADEGGNMVEAPRPAHQLAESGE
jgi:hypothetical protein